MTDGYQPKGAPQAKRKARNLVDFLLASGPLLQRGDRENLTTNADALDAEIATLKAERKRLRRSIAQALKQARRAQRVHHKRINFSSHGVYEQATATIAILTDGQGKIAVLPETAETVP